MKEDQDPPENTEPKEGVPPEGAPPKGAPPKDASPQNSDAIAKPVLDKKKILENARRKNLSSRGQQGLIRFDLPDKKKEE